eukprot:15346142-Ditylum_brightwellii.AAC.2
MANCCIVCGHRPQKTEPNRTRQTAGGDRINYPYDVSAPTADTTTAKIVINSTISTPNARYMCAEYKLHEKVYNGYVYMELHKCMYGLPQAGILANNLLTKRLTTKGYRPCQHTPGLWKHDWKSVTFSLVVDDFGI